MIWFFFCQLSRISQIPVFFLPKCPLTIVKRRFSANEQQMYPRLRFGQFGNFANGCKRTLWKKNFYAIYYILYSCGMHIERRFNLYQKYDCSSMFGKAVISMWYHLLRTYRVHCCMGEAIVQYCKDWLKDQDLPSLCQSSFSKIFLIVKVLCTSLFNTLHTLLHIGLM